MLNVSITLDHWGFSMHATKNDLPLETRVTIVNLLNEQLAQLIDLHLQAKQAHWNVKGPSFLSLHELFDQVAEMADEFVDKVAERIVALGGTAEGTLASTVQRTHLSTYPLHAVSGVEHIDAISTSISQAGKLARSAIDQASEKGDADTADLLTGLSRELDKKLWFVEAHLHPER